MPWFQSIPFSNSKILRFIDFQSDHAHEQNPREGKVQTGRITLHIEDQEATTLPGCPISSELPTLTSSSITSLTKTQIPRVCSTTMMAMPELANVFLIFQISSAHGDNEENYNESKIKMFKIIG